MSFFILPEQEIRSPRPGRSPQESAAATSSPFSTTVRRNARQARSASASCFLFTSGECRQSLSGFLKSSAFRSRPMYDKASRKIDSVVASVQRGERVFHPGWPILNWLFSGILYNISIPHIPELDKCFFTSDSCNGCSICVKLCPVANIEMRNGRPEWKHQCEQCWACFHWCPQKAVQSGKKSAGKTRYHHPDVKIADLIRR
jgi:Pyruvate/2-oxoacid:ferredoxin oxidoreductase delta subunit